MCSLRSAWVVERSKIARVAALGFREFDGMVVMCSIAPSGAVYSYLGVGAAAGDGVAAVAVGGLGRHVDLVLDVDVDGDCDVGCGTWCSGVFE